MGEGYNNAVGPDRSGSGRDEAVVPGSEAPRLRGAGTGVGEPRPRPGLRTLLVERREEVVLGRPDVL
jgi:hypothetical protein